MNAAKSLKTTIETTKRSLSREVLDVVEEAARAE